MNVIDAEKVLSYKSPLDVRITRFLFRIFCFHDYIKRVATSEDWLIGPILIKKCTKCGYKKYKTMD